MPECPICRRSYDARFQVFVPPHREAFDTVACARRGAEVWGWDKATPAAIVLPPVAAPAEPAAAPTFIGARHKKKMAAIAALAVAPGQAALATGVGLLAAGSAASIYLWAKPEGKATPVAVSAPHPRPTITPRPTATVPSKPFPVKHPAKQPRVAVTKQAHRAPTPAGTTRVSPRSSSPSPELISRPVPVTAPKPKPKPTTAKAPTATPKAPAAPPAKAPPPTKPPTPKPPTGGGGGGITSAAVPAPQRLPTSSSKSKKPKPTNPPPATPPPTTPPPTTTTDDEDTTRPGNGWGDKNHEHSGPPGNGDDGESSGDHGNGHGNGHDKDQGNGGGNGHGHGH